MKGGIQMTFKEKLENFKSKPVGFHIVSEEIAWLLSKVFTQDKLKMRNKLSYDFILGVGWGKYGKTGELYVSYNNIYTGSKVLAYGNTSISGKGTSVIYEITKEELKEYLEEVG